MASGWAIVGTGRFAANRIAPALNRAIGCRLVAVVSRDRDRAQEFASEHGAPRAYDDLEAAVRDQDVQCVWVATPHSLHLEPVLTALRAGKSVLCEKPLVTSLAEGQALVDLARERGVFLMEALWTRFLPAYELAGR